MNSNATTISLWDTVAAWLLFILRCVVQGCDQHGVAPIQHVVHREEVDRFPIQQDASRGPKSLAEHGVPQYNLNRRKETIWVKWPPNRAVFDAAFCYFLLLLLWTASWLRASI
jgi:hypothetical protein